MISPVVGLARSVERPMEPPVRRTKPAKLKYLKWLNREMNIPAIAAEGATTSKAGSSSTLAAIRDLDAHT